MWHSPCGLEESGDLDAGRGGRSSLGDTEESGRGDCTGSEGRGCGGNRDFCPAGETLRLGGPGAREALRSPSGERREVGYGAVWEGRAG